MMYNNELILLKYLLKKESYNKYKDFLDEKYLEEYHREISFLYKTLKSLHTSSEGSFALGDLQAAFYAMYPEADKKLYEGLFQALQDAEITEDGGTYVLEQIIARKRALKLSDLAFQVAQGFKKHEDLVEAMKDDHQPQVDDLPLKEVSTDLDILLENVYAKPGLRWRLDGLNKALGSLRSGDFGFIFARPETGKTTFLASEVSRFLEQVQRPIVWFNNEEDGEKVMLRIIQAFFGADFGSVQASKARFREEFTKRTEGRFKLFDSGAISRRDVETIVSKLNPELVLYDQIDKIKGFASDRDDLRLGAIYQWARELAKGAHAAIGVCQADGHAEGVRYLTMEHVANAKTSKQAEADFIVGIGKSHDDGLEQARFLNISKNKLLGDKDSLPELRHGKLEVVIRPDIARYEDVIRFS